MTRRSASRGILYSAPPTARGSEETTDESESADSPAAETEESAGETAAADD
ncbi:hypothetical protein [Halovenus sp. HT40]|uniref:hypothetical protein n=1 Tax=Halovenus sp. HT40 TaxID=3126691 RepID=UPI00300F62E4